jgi:hypothetical protein
VELVSARTPCRMPGGPSLAYRRRIPAIDADADLDDQTGTFGGIPLRCENHQNQNQGKDHPVQDAGLTMRQEDPPPASCSQRDRAQNPVNTTRTCNKLPPVNWFTGEVR